MKKSMVKLMCAIGLSLSMVCGAYALSSGDSLISLSYLTDFFVPNVVNEAHEITEQMLHDTYNDAQEELDEVQQELITQVTGSAAEYSPNLRERSWSCGDMLSLETGAGVLMYEGAAKVHHDGAFIDVTDGVELPNGAELVSGHRYLVGEETLADITILSGQARMGVQSSYELEKGEDGLPFYDLRGDDWFYDDVYYVYTAGLLTGVGDGRFAPELTMDRAMLMTAFYRLAGSPEREMEDATAAFDDVKEDAWYYSFVRWGATQKITSGTGENRFSPALTVTREQVVTLLYSFATNYLGMTLENRADITGFADYEQSSGWARDALAWAVEDGILDSDWAGENTLGAHLYASRGEVAAMLHAFAENIL